MTPGKALLLKAISIRDDSGIEAAGRMRGRADSREDDKDSPAMLKRGDIIALYSSLRGMFWTAEEQRIGSGYALKMRPREYPRVGYTPGNKFEVVIAPPAPAGPGGISRPRFALKSLLNDKLVAPNFRGRFHVDAEAGGARTWKTSNLFSVVHKTQITAIGSVKKLPIVKLWHEGDQQWLFIHDSLVHLDPRLGMCGSARNSAGASYFKVIFVKRGAKIREELASKLNFERNPMAAARTSARS